MSNVDDNLRNWRNSEVVRRPSNGRNDYRGNYENGRQGNQWFKIRNRFQKDDRRFNDRGYQFRNGGQKDDFSGGNCRNRGSSENFSRGGRRQRGRLNVLKVSDVQSDKTQSANEKSLAIPDSQIDKVVKTIVEGKVEIDLSKTRLEEKQKQELRDLVKSFQGLFSDKPGLKHVLYHEIDTEDKPSVVSRPYRYDRVKQAILDHHVDKMLKEGTITPIQSPYASPVVLCRKNNGLPPVNPEAYSFSVDYRKLNAITKYPRYPLPLIDNLIMSIPHTAIISALDLRSGYFQLAVNPSDIAKTAFVTKNGTYAFQHMSFGLSGAAPNFQKPIDIILKPVIGKSVNVYMDDVIISSPSFTQHIEHLKEVFRLLQDTGLTLNKDKCKFG
ncbi:retrovirus-related Pol polyprotein from transposon 297 [Trichonephila clavipes]|nr:retrovirus-related Pol polyprotein from transposon 297 [Trichonephila clavipes]